MLWLGRFAFRVNCRTVFLIVSGSEVCVSLCDLLLIRGGYDG